MTDKINKKYLLIIVGLIVLSLVAIFEYNKINKKEIESVKTNENILLNKENCEEFRDQINNSLMQYNASQKHEIRDSDNTGDKPSLGLYIEYKELKDLFYSPITQTCLYVESSKTIFKPGKDAKIDEGDWIIAYDTYYLTDVESGEQLKLKDDMPWAQRIVRSSDFYSDQEIQESINLYK